MKETYERIEMTVTVFKQEDVITTSAFVTRYFFGRDEYEGHTIEER